MNTLLYLLVVVLWGTTWIAISLQQQSEIAASVAVFWRFLIAASILFVWVIATGKLQRLTLKDHLFCMLQGCCVFGLNFICFYTAIQYINSGLEAVIFSMAVLFNAINARLFFGLQVSRRFYPAVMFGVLGMLALFWQDLIATHAQMNTLKGIALCMLGTYGFSLGNMISMRHQKRGLDILNSNAYAMLYGALLMGMISWWYQQHFLVEMPLVSVTALLYLAIFGSVVGFSAYFLLIGRIGAAKAAYSTLLFPLVALAVSTIWENYHWQWSAVLGVVLILCGNAIFFLQAGQWPSFKRTKTRTIE